MMQDKAVKSKTLTTLINVFLGVILSVTVVLASSPIKDTNTSLCYEQPFESGLNFLNTIGIFNGVTTPIKNISNTNLTDVIIIKTFKRINMTLMSKIGIDGVKKTIIKDGDGAHISSNILGSFREFNGSLFNKGIIYTIPKFKSGRIHTIYDKSVFTFNMSKIKIGAAYTKNGKRYYAVLHRCGGGDRAYGTGPFDAWDVSLNNTTPPHLNNRHISTKIVNKAFQLTLASLNKENDAYELKKGAGRVYVAIYPKGSSVAISNQLSFNATVRDHITSSDFNVSSAQKKAVVGFKFCATYNKNITTNKASYVLFPSISCKNSTVINDCNASTLGTPTWHLCYSTDEFAIRPYAFKIFGLNQYKRAGKNFNITIEALDDKGKPTKNYDENLTIQGNSPRLDYNDIKRSDGCVNGSLTGRNLIFKNGKANVTLKYSEVGDLNLTVREINGSEFAKVNESDTNKSQRFIQSYSKTITILPYRFDINASLSNNNGQKFTYLSNDLNMSAILDINITAQNMNNATTKNYNKKCYAKDTNLSISYTKLNITPSNALTKILYSDTNASIDGNSSISSHDINLTDINSSIFSNDNNGTGIIHLKINFDRNITKPVNPFDINVTDINVTDVNGTKGQKILDQNATFYYGRVHAPNYKYQGPSGSGKIYYEVYDDNASKKSLLPDGINTQVGVDSVNWYINTHNIASKDGKINSLKEDMSPPSVTATLLTTSSPADFSLKYNESQNYPYQTTMLITPSPWLVYNPYNPTTKTDDFNVGFYKAQSNWAGVHDTNTSTDSNASTVTIQRVLW